MTGDGPVGEGGAGDGPSRAMIANVRNATPDRRLSGGGSEGSILIANEMPQGGGPAPGLHKDADLIFDIGMNAGEDTDFYLRKGFRVVAVEANPLSCEAAGERFAEELATGQLTILNRAISSNRERLLFFLCRSQSAWSTASESLRDQWSRRGAVFERIIVPGMSSADLKARKAGMLPYLTLAAGVVVMLIANWVFVI